ncbi:MAG: PHP-associated domain-containing protein [Syntrophales bacterium]|nr:PHP-associated domain-containing protein [Syntrophales bacterium]
MEENLNVIGICDHNAGENILYVQKSAEGQPIVVLPGMELTSSEEVHVLALFDNLDDLMSLQRIVYEHLQGKNDENVFGCQVIVNEKDEVEGFNEHLLIGATDIPLIALIQHIHAYGGLAIASHIDRESFSVISQLGFISPDMAFDALEVSVRVGLHGARRRFPELHDRTFLLSSDAHFTRDIGTGFTDIFLENVSMKELKMAFERREGRFVRE